MYLYNSITLLLYIIFIVYIIYNSYYKQKSDYKIDIDYKIINNNYYLDLIFESYNKYPNIEKEIKSIVSYYKNESIPLFFLLDGIRLYAKSIRMTNITDKLNNRDGDIGMYYFQMKNYNQLVYYYDKVKTIKNICEIGFQLGVGAITLITSIKHKVTYYGFDYGNSYSKDSYKLVSKYFDMKMIWGDSQITLPLFIKTHQSFKKCDIVHIDGCHKQNVIFNDIINMMNISHTNSLLLLDDVNINSLSIIKAKNMNIIKNIRCYNWKPYCIAFYY